MQKRKIKEWLKRGERYRFYFVDRKSTNELWQMSAAEFEEDRKIITINYVTEGLIKPECKHTISSFINKKLSVRNIVNVDKLNSHRNHQLSRVQIASRCRCLPLVEQMEEIENFILNQITDDVQEE